MIIRREAHDDAEYMMWHSENGTMHNPDIEYSGWLAARTELAYLRARLAELEAERDSKNDSLEAWSDLWSHIVSACGGPDGLIPNESNFDSMMISYPAVSKNRYGTAVGTAELLAWRSDSQPTTVVAPRVCRFCREAAEQMRDAAYKTACRFVDEIHSPFVEMSQTVANWSMEAAATVAAAINALPLPDCAHAGATGCNPLKPNVTADQKARDMLERLGYPDAQSLTAGDVIEFANLIARVGYLEQFEPDADELAKDRVAFEAWKNNERN